MADFTFNSGMKDIADGLIAHASADLRVLLLKSSATPVPEDDYVSDVVAGSAEISVTGYGRQALGSQSTVVNDTDDRADIKAAKAVFSSLAVGQTVGWAIVYLYNASDSAARPLYCFDVTNLPTNGGDHEVHWNGVDGTGTYAYLGV